MNNQQYTYDDVRIVLVEEMAVEPEQLNGDPDIAFEDLGLDSLAGAELQVALQMKFGVEIPDDQAHNKASVHQVLEYLNHAASASHG